MRPSRQKPETRIRIIGPARQGVLYPEGMLPRLLPERRRAFRILFYPLVGEGARYVETRVASPGYRGPPTRGFKTAAEERLAARPRVPTRAFSSA